jgi:hypothetical protein
VRGKTKTKMQDTNTQRPSLQDKNRWKIKTSTKTETKDQRPEIKDQRPKTKELKTKE